MSVPTESDPPLAALTATTVLVGTNAMCVIYVLAAWVNSGPVVMSLEATLAWLVPVFAMVGALQYRLWVADGRLALIAKEEPRESAAMRRFRTMLIWSYVVLSVLALPAAGILSRVIGRN